MKKNGRSSLLLLIITIILFACSNYMGEEDAGSFTISVGGETHNEPSGRIFQYSSRAALDWDALIDSNNLDHEITVTDSAGNQHSYQILWNDPDKTAAFTSLPLGLCTIEVEGRDGFGNVQSYGYKEVTIVSGNNGAIPV